MILSSMCLVVEALIKLAVITFWQDPPLFKMSIDPDKRMEISSELSHSYNTLVIPRCYKVYFKLVINVAQLVICSFMIQSVFQDCIL